MWMTNFTANMEALLDCVEEGSVNWKTVVSATSTRIWMKRWKLAEKELEEVKIADEVTDVVCELCGRQYGDKIRSPWTVSWPARASRSAAIQSLILKKSV